MDYLSGVLERAKAANPQQPGDYTDEATGQLMCGKCHTPKTMTLMYNGTPITAYMMCKCAQERADREKKHKQAQKLRELCFKGNEQYERATFAADDGKSPVLMQAARGYIETFDTYRHRGKGLILLGPAGTGKTFAACCIANALIDRGYTVSMTNFIDVEARLHMAWDKSEVYSALSGPDLLILDDLGAERGSSYMDEIVYAVIDKRCSTGKPLIVTSNLSAKAFSEASTQAESRLLSRLYKSCIPVEAKGIDRRREVMQRETASDLKTLLEAGK